MNQEEKIESIKKYVAELTPTCRSCSERMCSCPDRHLEPVRLADVLLAVGDNLEQADVAVLGGFAQFDSGINDEWSWNLTRDSLDDQEPQTIDFIHHLLTQDQ